MDKCAKLRKKSREKYDKHQREQSYVKYNNGKKQRTLNPPHIDPILEDIDQDHKLAFFAKLFANRFRTNCSCKQVKELYDILSERLHVLQKLEAEEMTAQGTLKQKAFKDYVRATREKFQHFGRGK
jgi:hypothetical protein